MKAVYLRNQQKFQRHCTLEYNFKCFKKVFFFLTNREIYIKMFNWLWSFIICIDNTLSVACQNILIVFIFYLLLLYTSLYLKFYTWLCIYNWIFHSIFFISKGENNSVWLTQCKELHLLWFSKSFWLVYIHIQES